MLILTSNIYYIDNIGIFDAKSLKNWLEDEKRENGEIIIEEYDDKNYGNNLVRSIRYKREKGAKIKIEMRKDKKNKKNKKDKNDKVNLITSTDTE